MSATNKTWVNNSAPQLEDVDLNGFKNENNNLITGSGQTISTADNQQTHKAVSVYSHGGNVYTDSGSANSYVLSAIGAKIAPPSYFNGMTAVFEVGNTNTGASTVNVATLGSKNVYLNGAALVGGELVVGSVVALQYETTGDRFNIVWGSHITAADHKFTGMVTISSDVAKLNIEDANATANNKNWQIQSDQEKLLITAYNDAYTIGTTFLVVDRTATTVDTINFNNGTLQSKGNNVLTTADGLSTITKAKAADTVRSSTATLANDPDLFGWSLAAASNYKLEGMLYFFSESPGSTADGKFFFNTDQTMQTSPLRYTEVNGANINHRGDLITNIEILQLTFGTIHQVRVSVAINTHATLAATLDFQWAQNVSEANNLTLKQGSWISVSKLP